MKRREDVLKQYVPLYSLLFITFPILNRLQDLLNDPRIYRLGMQTKKSIRFVKLLNT